jgi:hypothetical protein
MDNKQWSEMSKNEKLDYLHERIQATDAEMTRISGEVGKAVMRLNSRIERIEKSGNHQEFGYNILPVERRYKSEPPHARG